MNYEFLQLLQFFAEVLSKVNKTSEQLQGPNLDLAKAWQFIFTLKTELEYKRNAGVINCNEKVENLCENCSISIERKQRLPPPPPSFSGLESPLMTKLFQNIRSHNILTKSGDGMASPLLMVSS